MSIQWTDDELNLLERLRPVFSTKEIRDTFQLLGLDRSMEAICKKSRSLQVRFKDYGEPASNGISLKGLEAIKQVIAAREGWFAAIEPPRPLTPSRKANITINNKIQVNEVLDALQEIRRDVAKTSSVSTKTCKSSKESLCLIFSDSHIGRILYDDQGKEFFSMKIGLDRIKSTPERLLAMLTPDQKANIDEIVILLIGDHVDGEGIFPAQEHHLETHAVEQVNQLTKAIWFMIKSFKQHFPVVRVVTTKGNHGRGGTSPESNWDNVLYQQLELLVDMEDNQDLTIKNRYGEFNVLEVKGWKGLLRHKAPVQADTGGAIAKFASWHGIHEWDFLCFLPGTKIVTSTGELRLIEDINKDLKLLGKNGLDSSIQEIHPAREIDEQVYRLRVEGLPDEYITGVTAEHPFYGIKNMNCRLPSRSTLRCHPDKGFNSYPCNECNDPASIKEEWIMSKDLSIGDYIAVPYPHIPEKARSYTDGLGKLLGYYAAEGSIVKETRKSKKPALRGVAWTLHKKELEIAEDIRCLVKRHFGLELHAYPAKNTQGIQYIAFGKEIAEYFLQAIGQYSNLKKLNTEVWNLGLQDRIDLIKGYMLGDGHSRIRKGHSQEYSASSASPNLVSGLYLLGLSCGLRPTFRIAHPELKEGSKNIYPMHLLTFSDESAEILLSKNEELQNKKTRVNGFFYNGMYFTRISKIDTFQYKGPVYNIKTDTENYVAGHLLTHNCYGHWHHWGVNTWCGKPIFRNGSLMGGDDYAESLAYWDGPVQLVFGVSEERLPTFVYPISYLD